MELSTPTQVARRGRLDSSQAGSAPRRRSTREKTPQPLPAKPQSATKRRAASNSSRSSYAKKPKDAEPCQPQRAKGGPGRKGKKVKPGARTPFTAISHDLDQLSPGSTKRPPSKYISNHTAGCYDTLAHGLIDSDLLRHDLRSIECASGCVKDSFTLQAHYRKSAKQLGSNLTHGWILYLTEGLFRRRLLITSVAEVEHYYRCKSFALLFKWRENSSRADLYHLLHSMKSIQGRRIVVSFIMRLLVGT